MMCQRSIILREIKTKETKAAHINYQTFKAVLMKILQSFFKILITVLQYINDASLLIELTCVVKKTLQRVQTLINNFNKLNKLKLTLE